MAANNREPSISMTVAHEGGYSNHPSDPGGPTKFGITIADYRRYVMPSATAADVRTLRLDEAKAIYRAKYWAALRCDQLPAGLDFAVFDYGVNSGVGRAGKVLQRIVGLAADGRIGDALVAAIRQRDARELIARLCDERLAFLKRLKIWPVFGSGWARRVAEVRAAALVMAESSRAPASARELRQSGAPGKGIVPINSQAQKSTAGGIAAAGAAAAQQAHHAGAPTVTILAIVLAAAALAVAGWLAWRWRQRHLQES